TVWGVSSWLVHVTVAPTGTVTVCGPKLKLSIFTSAFGEDGWSRALAFGDPADSSAIAITPTAMKLPTHTCLPVIVVFLSDVGSVCLSGILAGCPQRQVSYQACSRRFATLGPRAVRLPRRDWRGRCNRHRAASPVRDLASGAILPLRYTRTPFVPAGDPLASKPPTVRRRSRHR